MKRWQRIFWQWRGVLVTAPSVAAIVLLLRLTGLLQAWEWAAYDQYMRLRGNEPTDERVVIVGLDENDISALSQSTVSDEVMARLIEQLKAQSPRAIGLDFYRDLPVEPGHDALVDIYETTPYLVGIRKAIGEAGRDTVAPPPMLAALGQVGANDLVVDADNTVRRGLLSFQDSDGHAVYSLSLYLALLYLEPEGIGPEMVTENSWWLGRSLFSPFSASSGGYVRAADEGYQKIINYRGASRSFETVSFMDVLDQKVPSDWATDRVVLIGAVGESSNDYFYTPYSSTLLSLPETMAGVEVHANLTSQIISAAIEGRPLTRSWSEPVEWLWVLLWSGAGALMMWQFGQSNRQTRRGWQRELVIGSAIALLGGSTYVPFLYGWWLPVVPAFLAATGSAVSVMAYLARSAGDIRRTFGRYLSDEIVTTLLESPEGQKLGGERREITILTSDLRGFTATSERLPPETVIKVLNFYLGRMADVIARHNGTIDEFMGDGILILFGAPIQRVDDAKRAVACAVDMQLAMGDVNKTVREWGLAPLEMGIGIHTGEVVVGNIGSEKRTKYGVVGGPVNLTYRIESFTTGGQIFISKETRQAAAPVVLVRGEQTVKPKGVAEPITIYDISGVDAPYHLSLTEEKDTFYPLLQPIPVQFSLLQGKHIDSSMAQGCITQLSEKGAILTMAMQGKTVDAPPVLETLTNIKLNLLSDEGGTKSEDAYAKVLEKKTTSESSAFSIRFTAKPPAVAALLEDCLRQLMALDE
ncbi:MAG: adenylate/guanylate cyclase domain-containing protein [Cyanobacteria bacterium J06626_6]